MGSLGRYSENMRSLLTLVLVTTVSYSAPIRVAIIDSGLDFNNTQAPICPIGSRDFSGEGIRDYIGHGSHISDLIDQYAKARVRSRTNATISIKPYKVDYCQVILKYTHIKDNKLDMASSIEALSEALRLNVDIINYSGGGGGYNVEESRLIKLAISKGIKVIVAAGNDGKELGSLGYDYYPAMYGNGVVVVGSKTGFGGRANYSNYGRLVNVWEFGSSRLALGLDGNLMYLSGTSQATAIHTGKVINQMLLEQQ